MSTSTSTWELLANATSDRLCQLPGTCGEDASACTSTEDLSAELVLAAEASDQLVPETDSRSVANLRPHRWAGTLPGSMAGKRPPAAPSIPIVLGC